MSGNVEPQTNLRHVAASLGGYRAEQLEDQGRLYRLFSAPSFMAELETNRSCLLVGGRGTGKTTLLKGLSLRGQMYLLGQGEDALSFVGVYLRINSNRVAAFSGPELPQERWDRVFAHYVNLLLIDELLRTIQVLQDAQLPTAISEEGLELTCLSLHLEPCDTLESLHTAVRYSMVRIEAGINNVGDGLDLPLSMQGQPVDILIDALKDGPVLKNRLLFFLIDEYENLSREQQSVFNTLIKHARSNYSFKIGVKSLGLKTRETLVATETLSYPADYEQIDIVERLEAEGFPDFASRVVELRWEELPRDDVEDRGKLLLPPVEWLRSLSMEEEAIVLGIETLLRDLSDDLRQTLSKMELEALEYLPGLDRYAIAYLEPDNQVAAAREAIKDPVRWARRVNNHRYAMLFSIRRGRVGLRKHYAGWPTICALAAGNTRFLLQIVTEIALAQQRLGHALEEPVPPDVQTRAAQEVGYRNLMDLEGIARDGASIVRLVLGLGRVFGIMASRPQGHAPEVNQFALSESSNSVELQKATSLLDSAVQHQALVDFAGNKLAKESGETRTANYMLHPIYCAFFVFSHRKQRKLRLSADELIGFVEKPTSTIRRVLAKTDREQYLESDDIEGQLALFAEFYGLPESP